MCEAPVLIQSFPFYCLSVLPWNRIDLPAYFFDERIRTVRPRTVESVCGCVIDRREFFVAGINRRQKKKEEKKEKRMTGPTAESAITVK